MILFDLIFVSLEYKLSRHRYIKLAKSGYEVMLYLLIYIVVYEGCRATMRTVKKKFLNRFMLEEVGRQADQHESIGSAYTGAVNVLKKRGKEVKKEVDGNKKQFKDKDDKMNKSYHRVENATKKYRDAHNAMETASSTYDKKSKSMDVTINDIEKAKHLMEVKIEACQKAKSDYESQVLASNQEQNDHYRINIPNLITR